MYKVLCAANVYFRKPQLESQRNTGRPLAVRYFTSVDSRYFALANVYIEVNVRLLTSPKATAEGTFNPEGTQLNELMYEVKMY